MAPGSIARRRYQWWQDHQKARGILQNHAPWCRMWTALQACSRCTGVVVIHRRQCVMHCGVARAGHLPGRAVLGPMAEAAIKKGSPTYMANLILFPGGASLSMSCFCHAPSILGSCCRLLPEACRLC